MKKEKIHAHNILDMNTDRNAQRENVQFDIFSYTYVTLTLSPYPFFFFRTFVFSDTATLFVCISLSEFVWLSNSRYNSRNTERGLEERF